MKKEKQMKLTRYLNNLEDKLTSKHLPLKHTNRPASYRLFLNREIATVKAKLAAALIEGVEK